MCSRILFPGKLLSYRAGSQLVVLMAILLLELIGLLLVLIGPVKWAEHPWNHPGNQFGWFFSNNYFLVWRVFDRCCYGRSNSRKYVLENIGNNVPNKGLLVMLFWGDMGKETIQLSNLEATIICVNAKGALCCLLAKRCKIVVRV